MVAEANIAMNVLQNPFACAFCEESFSFPNSLVTHVEETHTSVKAYESNSTRTDKVEVNKDKTFEIQCKLFKKDEVKTYSNSKEQSKESLEVGPKNYGTFR